MDEDSSDVEVTSDWVIVDTAVVEDVPVYEKLTDANTNSNNDSDLESDGISVISETTNPCNTEDDVCDEEDSNGEFSKKSSNMETCDDSTISDAFVDNSLNGIIHSKCFNNDKDFVDSENTAKKDWTYIEPENNLMHSGESRQFYLNCLQEPVQELLERDLGTLHSDFESDEFSVISESESGSEFKANADILEEEIIEKITNSEIEKISVNTKIAVVHDNMSIENIFKKYLSNSIIVGVIILVASVLIGQFLTKPIEENVSGYDNDGATNDLNEIQNSDKLYTKYDPKAMYNYCSKKHEKDDVFTETNIRNCMKKMHTKFEKKGNQKELIEVVDYDYLKMKEKLLNAKEKELIRKEKKLLNVEKKIKENLDFSDEFIFQKNMKDHSNPNADYYVEILNVNDDYISVDDLAPVVSKKQKSSKARDKKQKRKYEDSSFEGNKKVKKHEHNIEEEQLEYKDKLEGSKPYYKKYKKYLSKKDYFKESPDEYRKNDNYKKSYSEDWCNNRKSKYKKFCKETLGKKIAKEQRKIEESWRKYDKKLKYENNKDEREWLINYDPVTKSYEYFEVNITKNDVEHLLHALKGNKTLPAYWLASYYKRRNLAREDIRKKEQSAKWYFDRVYFRRNKRNKAKWYFDWMTYRNDLRFM